MYVESLPVNTGHSELYEEFHNYLAGIKGHVETREVVRDDAGSVENGNLKQKGRSRRFRWM